MPFCTGNGDLVRDGCCYVEGKVCPLRWKIEGGHIYDHVGADLGTVDNYITSVIPNKPGRDRAKAQVTGAKYLCRAAIDVLVADPKLLNNRPGFEAAWNAHPEYVAKVRPAWRVVEQNIGLPEGGYNCSTWKGGCCFTETTAENEAKAQGLSADARTVRAAAATP